VLASIDAVTRDDIRAVAAEILTRPRALAVVGPFDRPPRHLPGLTALAKIVDRYWCDGASNGPR
jgi:hypothetical protein